MRDLSPFIDPLIAAHVARGSFTPSGAVPGTVAEAYAVHAALVDTLGPVGGFKVSRKPGQEAVVAPIPEARCFPSDFTVDTPSRVGVELEVGFVVIGETPAPDDPEFRRKLLEAVRPAPMIELVTTRIDGPLADDPFVKLADLQACEALVFGAPVEGWNGSDFSRPEVEFFCDEGPIHQGAGTVPGGSACDALVAAVRALGDRFGGVRPGCKILTGTMVPLTYIPAGQTVTGRISGLGEVLAHV